MRPVDVSTGIMINSPVEKVSAFAADPDNATKWYTNIKSVAWKTSKGPVPGSQIEFTADFLGRKLVYTYEIVEFIPNEKFVMRTADGPFPMETTYSWKKVSGNGTWMELRNKGMPSGFTRFVALIMEFAIRKANRQDLKRLKNILETK